MLAQTAKIDLAALRAAGCEPTDEQIVRLNDLALRIERGQETTPENHPRIAFAGNVVLHEPTIGAVEWWLQYGKRAANDPEDLLHVYFFMMAHARRLEVLDGLEAPGDVMKAVKAWMKKVDATDSELLRAMIWAKCGDGDVPQPKSSLASSLDSDMSLDLAYANLIAAAGLTHMLPDDLKTLTNSALTSMLVKVAAYAGQKLRKTVAEDYIAYKMVMKEIEDSKHKEKTDG